MHSNRTNYILFGYAISRGDYQDLLKIVDTFILEYKNKIKMLPNIYVLNFFSRSASNCFTFYLFTVICCYYYKGIAYLGAK